MIYGIAIFPEHHVQVFANSFRKRYDPHYTLIPPHITLKEAFEIPDEPARERIIEAIGQISAAFAPFTLKITKVSTFYPANNTLYLAIEEEPLLRKLFEKLHEGILTSERPYGFIPHVTIGQQMSAEELQDVYGQWRMKKIEMETRVDRFHLLYRLDDGVWTVYQTFILGKRG